MASNAIIRSIMLEISQGSQPPTAAGHDETPMLVRLWNFAPCHVATTFQSKAAILLRKRHAITDTRGDLCQPYYWARKKEVKFLFHWINWLARTHSSYGIVCVRQDEFVGRAFTLPLLILYCSLWNFILTTNCYRNPTPSDSSITSPCCSVTGRHTPSLFFSVSWGTFGWGNTSCGRCQGLM